MVFSSRSLSVTITKSKHIMADVAHLVRATGCGSVGSGFDPHHSPQNKIIKFRLGYFILEC